MIPYTWDGSNASTYNYLTQAAPSTTGITTTLTAPIVTSPSATNVINTVATLGGNVFNDGGSTITDRGIVWSIYANNANPTIGGVGCTNLTTSGTTGVFTTNATGLPAGTNIAYVAYATNSIGTTYSTVGTFTTNTAATHLAYGVAPPASGNAGQNLTAFTIEARRGDNTVDAEFTGAVALTKLTGTGSMTGTTSVNAINGVATFNAVQFNQEGTYTIQASTTGITATNPSESIIIAIANDAVGEWIDEGNANAWHTNANWSNNFVPTGAMFARFNNTGGATTCAVNVNTGSPNLSGIEVSALRTRNLTIGASSSVVGTMTLNGGYNDQLPNTIILNKSGYLLSFVPNISNNGTMNIVLGNTTENVIRIDGAGDVAISSIISGTDKNLTKAGSGSGKLILSGNNTYSGETRVNTGTIEITANERIANTSNLVLNGGEFSTGATTGYSETLGTLNVASNSSVHLGTGVHSLTFAESDAVVWNGSSLTIFGWTGTNGTTGNAGKIFVGTSSTGLTAEQLAKISFNGFAGNAMQLNTGEIVPQAPLDPTNAVLSGTNSICEGATADLTVAITGGESPYTIVYNNGTSDVSVLNYISGTTISVNPSTTTTYTLVSVTDANLYPSAAVTGSALITVNQVVPDNTANTYSATTTLADGTTQNYTTNFCEAIGQITDAADGNILGSTTMTAYEAADVTNTTYKYLRRSYKVTPTSDGAMTIKFYFTQEDFNNYNANATNHLKLPLTGNNSDVNKEHFRVSKYANGVYTPPSLPMGDQLVWNGTYWEFTLPVTSVGDTTYYFGAQTDCNGVAVSDLAAGNLLPDAATWTWTTLNINYPYAGYEFQYRVQGDPTWISAGTANNGATSKLKNGLAPGTTYEVQARSKCNIQSFGPWTNSVVFTTTSSGCNTPMTFNAPTTTHSTATLTWTTVPGAGWYSFEYKETSSSTWISAGTLGAAATSKTFSGLNANTSYDFRGRTHCPSGTPSAWSAVATATTATSPACAVPPTLSASTTGYTATITWPSVVGAVWFEFRYKETISPTWISAGTLGGAATSKMLSSLVPSTNYDFQARTFCSNGQPSAWSSTLAFTTLSLAGCELPPADLLASNITTNSAKVNWTAVQGAAWYEFRYKESSSPTWLTAGTLGGAAVQKSLTGLSAGTDYHFQARTFCSNFRPSAWSSTLQFTTQSNNNIAAEDESKLEELAAQEGHDVFIFPNPANDIVHIRLSTAKAILKITDVQGREIKQMVVEKEASISLTDVAPGIYFFEVKSDNGTTVKRVVKQ